MKQPPLLWVSDFLIIQAEIRNQPYLFNAGMDGYIKAENGDAVLTNGTLAI